MKKIEKGIISKVNPYDLGTVAHVTQKFARVSFSSTRSTDVYSAGGKNSSSGVKGSMLKTTKK
jgi:hypothetical protein